MKFTKALDFVIEKNTAMYLPSWGENQLIFKHVPNKGDRMTRPHLFFSDGTDRYPWTPSAADIFRDDWEIL